MNRYPRTHLSLSFVLLAAAAACSGTGLSDDPAGFPAELRATDPYGEAGAPGPGAGRDGSPDTPVGSAQSDGARPLPKEPRKDAAGPSPSAEKEVIVAHGQYWIFDNAPGFAPAAENGSQLTQLARYATGPCAGHEGATCTLDSQAVFLFNGSASERLTESVTAYGKFWNFDVANGYTPLLGNGMTLDSLGRYASGPCTGQAAGACLFDTRAVFVFSGRRTESITAYGKFWNFDVATDYTPLAGNGSYLETVPRYASGPCAGQGAGACVFDTRTVFSFNGRMVESITAYGKFWNFDIDTNYGPMAGNGSNLETVARFAAGPCAGVAPGACRFDVRSVF